MKYRFILALMILFFMPALASAQTTFYSDTANLNVCDTSYYLNIAPNSADYSGFNYNYLVVSGSVINHNFGLFITWGDGTNTTHSGTAVSNGTAIVWNTPTSHTYSNGGQYVISMLLVDSTNQTTYNLNQIVNIGVCTHQATSIGLVDCDNDGTVDTTLSGQIPLVLTDTLGNEYTSNSFWNTLLFYGLPTGYYTVSVDSAWLALNNYTVDSILPSSISASFSNNSTNFQVILNCDTTNFISNCLNGVVFCDANNNGEFDTNEIPAGGAPLTLHLPNGSTQTFTADPNGLYSFNFMGFPTGGYVSVDQNWMNTNGYLSSSNFTDTISSLDCTPTANPTLNIPIICDSSALSNCVSGFVFCDANNNGILDTNETTVGGAPMSLVLTDGSLNVFTSNPDGSYNLTYYNPSNLSGDMFVHWPWLDSMNYFYSPFIDSVNASSCDSNAIHNVPLICDTNALSVGCIDGYVYCDDNNNGIFDSTETVYYNAPVTLSGLGGLITVYTDSNGYYSYSGWQLSGGTVLVSLEFPWQTNNSAFVSGNGVFISNLDCANNNTTNLGLNCNSTSTCADLWSSVTPWIGYYQNTTNSVWLKYGNYGSSAPGSYTVTLDFPSGVTPVQSSINNQNYSITGNTITWTLNSTQSSMYFSDVIYFTTPAGIADSTLHIFSSTISSATSDCDSSNNYYSLGMLVGVSYDPNDKSVNRPPIVDPNVQDEYTYLVRFQNTGTAPAQDVFILDTLSTNLDWSTFQLLETSHPMQLVDLGNGLIKFDFPQIWLPDSTTNEPLSHGHVIYRIKELASLGEGDVIENTAYIYFDQNAPIITNTTVNTNTMSLSVEAVGTIDFNVYPNPAQSFINVQAGDNLESIRINDLSGKIVFESAGNSTLENINIEGLSKGLYNIEVKTSNGIGRRLFVKE